MPLPASLGVHTLRFNDRMMGQETQVTVISHLHTAP